MKYSINWKPFSNQLPVLRGHSKGNSLKWIYIEERGGTCKTNRDEQRWKGDPKLEIWRESTFWMPPKVNYYFWKLLLDKVWNLSPWPFNQNQIHCRNAHTQHNINFIKDKQVCERSTSLHFELSQFYRASKRLIAGAPTKRSEGWGRTPHYFVRPNC